MIERWCTCDAFTLWYDDVCVCGHLDETHVDGQRLCVGDVIVYFGGEPVYAEASP